MLLTATLRPAYKIKLKKTLNFFEIVVFIHQSMCDITYGEEMINFHTSMYLI